jgi:hypothetical protein
LQVAHLKGTAERAFLASWLHCAAVRATGCEIVKVFLKEGVSPPSTAQGEWMKAVREPFSKLLMAMDKYAVTHDGFKDPDAPKPEQHIIDGDSSAPTWAMFVELRRLAAVFKDQVSEHIFAMFTQVLTNISERMTATYMKVNSAGDWKVCMLREPSSEELRNILLATDAQFSHPFTLLSHPLMFYVKS